MGTQIIDSAIVNNLSIRNILLETTTSPNKASVFDELKQLEAEVEEKKRMKELEKRQTTSALTEPDYQESNIFMDIPIIPTNQLVLPSICSLDEKSEFGQEEQTVHTDTPSKIETKISNLIKDIGEMKSSIEETFSNEEDISQLPPKPVIEESKPVLLQDPSNLGLTSSLSNNSIASTLTNLSQQNCQPQWQLETMPEWLVMDAHVIVSTNTVQNKPGFVRFIGPTKFAHGTWIGVELEQPYGKNDGALKGIRYFRCPENKGVFVKPDKLTLVNKI